MVLWLEWSMFGGISAQNYLVEEMFSLANNFVSADPDEYYGYDLGTDDRLIHPVDDDNYHGYYQGT